MSRRPPRDYYEEDDFEIERERDRNPRSRQRDREFEEEDVQYRRRRSMPPVEDLERMHIRDRPPRDFMRESYAPPEDRAPMSLRRPRDNIDGVIPEREREEVYIRPSRERRRPRREIDEEQLFINERERHGGQRRRRSERDIEEDLIIRRRERPSRDYESESDFKPRERFEEQDETFVRRSGPRRKPRPRSREEELEELLVDESEMDRPRRRPSLEEPIFEREEINEVMIDDRERPRERRPRRESNYDRYREMEDVIDDRESERLRERKLRKPRVKEELVMQWKDRPLPGEFDEEEIRIRETRRPTRRSPPMPVFAPEPPGALPLRGNGIETEEQIRISSRSRPRPHHRDVEEEEEMVIRRDEKERDRRRRTKIDDEILLRREDKSRGHRSNNEEDEELLIRREERDRDRRRATKDDEELIIRRDERDRPRKESEDEVIIRKSKRRSSPRKPSPDVASIHAPPIHQDVITHHHHIDHGFEAPPRAPSPDASSQTSIDEVHFHHRRKSGSHKSEEDLVYKHRSDDESVSPTSRPSLDFNNPWEADGASTSRRRPKSIIDETESIKPSLAGSTRSRAKRSMARDLDFDEETDEEEIEVHEERYGPRSSTRSLGRDVPDAVSEWSMVHTPKTDALEMPGALNVIEVSSEPRDERWTEITKDLVVREAIERLGYEFEETRTFYYIFSYLKPGDIDEIVELSDEIRAARRRRIREMHRERAVPPPRPPRPRSLVDRMPPRARMAAERRMREREWIIDARR
ncbi:uncharacterized protein N7477_007592 [Penicillium maclennaniae]|uniref:uncharacterized protein n=1 Tax=Penicillium maclennaniae TaxID=1343394 RepID=UPI00254179CA|nr:uncharacterized protein N7477_007592 [Penicillium maclennaniae]KAJ5665144.1 hypothetical protein N7477_007592 [Penicillium maclennaniae]